MACTSLVMTSSLLVSVVLGHLDNFAMVYEDLDDKVYDCLWDGHNKEMSLTSNYG